MDIRSKRIVYSGRRKKGRSQESCYLCGKPTTGQTLRMIHVGNGGLDVIHPDDEHSYKDPTGDMGFFPIGPFCAHKMGLEWTYDVREGMPVPRREQNISKERSERKIV